MRFVTYQRAGRTELGVRTPAGIVATGHPGLRDYLEEGAAAVERLERLLASGPAVVTPDRMLTPLAERCQLICVGGNYADHLAEVRLELSEPVYFPKLWSAVLQPGEPLRMPEPATDVDYEVEFALIIGKTAGGSPSPKRSTRFGYTVVNDIGARDVMAREAHADHALQSADGFPAGRRGIVTADEVDIYGSAIHLHRQRRAAAEGHPGSDDLQHPVSAGVPHPHGHPAPGRPG